MKNIFIHNLQFGDNQLMIIYGMRRSDAYMCTEFSFLTRVRHYVSNFCSFSNHDLVRLLEKGVLKAFDCVVVEGIMVIYYCLTDYYRDNSIYISGCDPFLENTISNGSLSN